MFSLETRWLNTCVVLGTIALTLVSVCAKFSRENCEACCNMVDDFTKTLSDDQRTDLNALDEEFKSFCKKQPKEHEYRRLCYNIGGLEDSATYIVRELTKPLSYFKPAEKICEALKKKDAQICDIRAKKKLDLTKVDLKKLKVKQLKEILDSWDRSDAYKGFAEKTEFIRVIEELMPKYDKAAYEARKQKSEL